ENFFGFIHHYSLLVNCGWTPTHNVREHLMFANTSSGEFPPRPGAIHGGWTRRASQDLDTWLDPSPPHGGKAVALQYHRTGDLGGTSMSVKQLGAVVFSSFLIFATAPVGSAQQDKQDTTKKQTTTQPGTATKEEGKTTSSNKTSTTTSTTTQSTTTDQSTAN